MDSTLLFLSLLFSTVGFGFFVFGKKQKRPIPLLVGIALMVYPYFISDIFAMVTIGIVLILIPWIAKKFF